LGLVNLVQFDPINQTIPFTAIILSCTHYIILDFIFAGRRMTTMTDTSGTGATRVAALRPTCTLTTPTTDPPLTTEPRSIRPTSNRFGSPILLKTISGWKRRRVPPIRRVNLWRHQHQWRRRRWQEITRRPASGDLQTAAVTTRSDIWIDLLHV